MLDFKNQESRRNQEMSELPVTKSMGFIICVVGKCLFFFFFASFCYFFNTFVPGRTFLHYCKYIKQSPTS